MGDPAGIGIHRPPRLVVGSTFGEFLLQILAPIHLGETHAIYEVRDPASNQVGSLLLLRGKLSSDDDSRLRMAARTSADNVVEIFGAGFDADTGLSFVRMGKIHGSPLSQVVKLRQFDPLEAIIIMRRVAEAIDAIHENGIEETTVTADLIFLSNTEPSQDASAWRVKVVNWGIPGTTVAMLPGDESITPRSHIADLRALAEIARTLFGLPSVLPAEGFPDSASRWIHEKIQRWYEVMLAFYPRSGTATYFVRTLTKVLGVETAGPTKGGSTTSNAWSSTWKSIPSTPLESLSDIERRKEKGSDDEEDARKRAAAFWAKHFEKERLSNEAEAPAVRKDAQFTVYRPKVVIANVWHEMLVFAHPSKRAPDAPADAPDPLEDVARQAARFLENVDEYRVVVQDAKVDLPQGVHLRFVPEVEGVVFNPEQREFDWIKDVHREHFEFRCGTDRAGKTLRGSLRVYFGVVLVAEASLSLEVAAAGSPRVATLAPPDRCSAYQKIFVSYSHQDEQIVNLVAECIGTLGNSFLRDCFSLRSGEVWDTGLEKLIREADIFQLFWSTHSKGSRYVEREWRYALGLMRQSFIRPVYWEEPLPDPPHELQPYHFHKLAQARAAPVATQILEPSGTSHGLVTKEAGAAPVVPTSGTSLARMLTLSVPAVVVIAILGWLLAHYRWW